MTCENGRVDPGKLPNRGGGRVPLVVASHGASGYRAVNERHARREAADLSSHHKPGSRADIAALRRRMLLLGASSDAVAAEIGRTHGHRPRQAYRLAAGWDQADTAARYNSLIAARGPAHAGRDTMTPARVSEYERWPDSPRRPPVYVLHALAELYATTVDRLLDHTDLEALPPIARATLAAVPAPPAAVATCGPAQLPAGRASIQDEHESRRRRRAALVEAVRDGDGVDLQEAIIESADQSAEAALLGETNGLGDAGFPILHHQLAGLAAAFEHTPPRPLLGRALAVRNRALDLLEGRHPHPEQLRDLHVVAATSCAMLAWICGDLGQHRPALTHAAAAWTFADRAGQPMLRAFVRTAQAKSAYWAGQVTASADYARDGLDHAATAAQGTLGVLLASMWARAAAHARRDDDARAALARAQAERDAAGTADGGGLYACSLVGQECFAAGTHVALGDPTAALDAADRAEQAHHAASTVGIPAFRSITMARVNALTAHVHQGDLAGARHAFTQIVALPAERRIATFVVRLDRATNTLAGGQYRTNPAAGSLADDIRDFQRNAAAQALPHH